MNTIGDIEKRIHQREVSNRYINRPVEFLIKHHITPNMISFIGFLCTSIAALLIALGWLYSTILFGWLIPALFGLAGAFDLFDGEVARRTDKETQAGAFLDSNLDRLSDAIIILGLIYGGLVNYILGYIILFLVLMISYIRSRAEIEGVNMKGVGYMERAERIMFLLFTLIIELTFYHLPILITGKSITIFVPFITGRPVTPIFFISIIIFTLALIYTVIQRLTHSFKSLKNLNYNKVNSEASQ